MDSSIDEIAKVIMDPLINNSKDNRIYMWLDEKLSE
jgi:hypothetical protein